MKCNRKCEVWSRCVGYHRPIQNWNKGKKAEEKDRTVFDLNISLSRKDVSNVLSAFGVVEDEDNDKKEINSKNSKRG